MKKAVKKVYDLVFGKELSILPGNLAFSFFLSVIPILSLLLFFLTSFNLPMDVINNFMKETFPSGVVDLLQPIFTNEISLNSLITLVFGIIVSANGCNAIIMTSNTIFNIENSSYIKRFIKSIFLTLCIIILISFIVIVPLLGRTILSFIGNFTSFIADHEGIVNTIYLILQVPVSIVFVFFFIKLVYTIAPDEHIKSKYVNKGALFTTMMWLLVTTIYSYYINNIARYDLVYGNLANIVILLLWFYVLAYIFVIGLCLNKKETEEGIEKTNSYKLEEIRNKIKNKK